MNKSGGERRIWKQFVQCDYHTLSYHHRPIGIYGRECSLLTRFQRRVSGGLAAEMVNKEWVRHF